MNKKIIFSAGGTGGHIFPATNLMKHFSDKGYEVVLVTDKRGKKFINNISKFKSYEIAADTPTNKKIFKKIFAFFLIFLSVFRSISIIKKEKPDLIFGTGGYISFPISLASNFFGLSLVIYESNIMLGRANKFLLSFSKKIFLSREISMNFPEKYKNKTHIVGAVLDKKIINYKPKKITNEKQNFSILILGGSQGAEIFGKVIPTVINMLETKNFKIEVMQQCTKNQKDEIKKFYEKNNIKNYVFEFDKDILNLMASANLAITRCGANTTAELVQMLTPFIGVPLPNSIDNHQYFNAKYYELRSCCWTLEQNESEFYSKKYFNEKNLYNLIVETIENKNKLEIIRENMKKNYTSDVYNIIETQIKKII
jgi:UDP-N-acetylglucosamine--N-acetylmuramyl-(pentapeptide) pyrophosphoryl-undecaprenol N-acetylglucosamine transferase